METIIWYDEFSVGVRVLDEQHKEFKVKMVHFCSATTQGLDKVPDILLNYLREWWVDHIINEDMAYRSFFEEKGIV